MRQRGSKNRQGVSLISHNELVRLRTEKEKIITNPFEENWKKAIVMEQLLNLYEPQEAGFTPTASCYDKQDYNSWAGAIKNGQNQQELWEDNEDRQVNKLHKMAEGIARWQQHFHSSHIDTMFLRVGNRKKTLYKSVDTNSDPKKDSKRLKTRHRNKTRHKNRIKEGRSTFDQQDQWIVPKRPLFTKQIKQLEQLKATALSKYGVIFSKEAQTVDVKMDLQEFRKRDTELFQRFAKSMKHSRTISRQSLTCTQKDLESVPPQFDRIVMQTSTKLSQKDIKVCQAQKIFPKKRYIRIN